MSSKYAFTKTLKEVRFHFCQTSEPSAAVRYLFATPFWFDGKINRGHRSFLTRAYPIMKKNNPHIPIMLREALGTEPRVFARYGELWIRRLK